MCLIFLQVSRPLPLPCGGAASTRGATDGRRRAGAGSRRAGQVAAVPVQAWGPRAHPPRGWQQCYRLQVAPLSPLARYLPALFGFDLAPDLSPAVITDRVAQRQHRVDLAFGLLIFVMVTSASVQERDAGQELRIDIKGKTRRLKKVIADHGYKQWG